MDYPKSPGKLSSAPTLISLKAISPTDLENQKSYPRTSITSPFPVVRSTHLRWSRRRGRGEIFKLVTHTPTKPADLRCLLAVVNCSNNSITIWCRRCYLATSNVLRQGKLKGNNNYHYYRSLHHEILTPNGKNNSFSRRAMYQGWLIGTVHTQYIFKTQR